MGFVVSEGNGMTQSFLRALLSSGPKEPKYHCSSPAHSRHVVSTTEDALWSIPFIHHPHAHPRCSRS